MADKNTHFETVDSNQIRHEVWVSNVDLIGYHSWQVRSERRKKVSDRFGPLTVDRWQLDGDALVFTVTDSRADGTFNGPYSPNVEVQPGVRDFSVGNFGTDMVIGRKATYNFETKEFTVEAGTNWVTRGAILVLLIILVIVILIIAYLISSG